MACAILLAGLLIAAPVMAANENPVKIGVIDIQKIMRQSKAAKSAQAVFSKELEARRATMKAKEKEVQLLEEELKSSDQKLSPEARREKGNTLNREVRELKRLAADLEEELKKKDAELTRKLLGEILQIVTTFAKKEHYYDDSGKGFRCYRR